MTICLKFGKDNEKHDAIYHSIVFSTHTGKPNKGKFYWKNRNVINHVTIYLLHNLENEERKQLLIKQ